MPDYEIKEWNEDNFDVNAIPFVKQAYEEHKWAFVADVCRFYACYNEGGFILTQMSKSSNGLTNF